MPERLPIMGTPPSPEDVVNPAVAAGKRAALRGILTEKVREGAVVAFSGGVDSAFLLSEAAAAQAEAGGTVLALTTVSPSTPPRDMDDARLLSSRLGVEHLWEESREFLDPAYLRNDRTRCYHCKTELFRIAGELASERGLRWVLYGYNASDEGDDRPGHRAAVEAGALAPLAAAGLTKGEIRHLMAEAGIPFSSKPASPCLSSRIMTGVSVTPERLEHVKELEELLAAAGISTVRVRVCDDGAGSDFLRIEVRPEDMDRVMACREDLIGAGTRHGYRWVTLDLAGYRMGGGVR